MKERGQLKQSVSRLVCIPCFQSWKSWFRRCIWPPYMPCWMSSQGAKQIADAHLTHLKTVVLTPLRGATAGTRRWRYGRRPEPPLAP